MESPARQFFHHHGMMSLRSPDRVILETERLILRLPHRGDETGMARFYAQNREFLQPFSPVFDEALFTPKGWRGRIDATLAEYRAAKGLRLVLFLKSDPGTPIGIANFTSISPFPVFGCNLGYSIGEAFQGQGLMTEALRCATEYLFRAHGIHRIEANYMPRNVGSGRVLEKLGFVIEGHAKDYILIDDKWEDHVRTSLTNRDWQPWPVW